MNLYELLLTGAAILVILFSSVLLFGAPYLPTLRLQISMALDLLGLEEGQTLLEIGSGDGRVLREAARRGIRGIGYEINPLLVIYSKCVTFKYRKLVKIYWRNFWKVPLPVVDGVYVFLLKPYMMRLQYKFEQEFEKPTKVASFTFAFTGLKPIKRQGGIMLYQFGGSLRRGKNHLP